MTSWHLFVEAELRGLLGIPDNVFMAAAITMGRPVGHHGPVRRRPSASSSTSTSGEPRRRSPPTRREPVTPGPDRPAVLNGDSRGDRVSHHTIPAHH